MEKLDGFVEQGTSEQHFSAEYLLSHISCAVAICENRGKIFPHDIRFQIVNSLQNALGSNELTEKKQAQVLSMWEHVAKS